MSKFEGVAEMIARFEGRRIDAVGIRGMQADMVLSGEDGQWTTRLGANSYSTMSDGPFVGIADMNFNRDGWIGKVVSKVEVHTGRSMDRRNVLTVMGTDEAGDSYLLVEFTSVSAHSGIQVVIA